MTANEGSLIPKHVEINGQKTLRIAIGTARMGWKKDGGDMVPDYKHDAEHIRALNNAFSLGYNHVDSAQKYGDGHTSEIVGEAIRGKKRSELFVATKIGDKPITREQTTEAIEREVGRLGFPDLVYVHDQWHDQGAMEEPMDNCIAGLNDAKDSGLIYGIGVSNFTLDQLKRAMDKSKHPITAIQSRFNVLSHPLITKELLEFCRANNVLVAAHTALGRGQLVENVQNQKLLAVAHKYGKMPALIALNWLLNKKGVIAVVRSHNKNHLAQNLTAFDFKLDPADYEVLDGLGETRL